MTIKRGGGGGGVCCGSTPVTHTIKIFQEGAFLKMLTHPIKMYFQCERKKL